MEQSNCSRDIGAERLEQRDWSRAIGAERLDQSDWSRAIGAEQLEQRYWRRAIRAKRLEQSDWSRAIGALFESTFYSRARLYRVYTVFHVTNENFKNFFRSAKLRLSSSD